MNNHNVYPLGDIYQDGYIKINHHGMIANNRTAALVGMDGTIDWACFPNFNSNPLFFSILDKNKGGYFSISPLKREKLYVHQYYEDFTNVLVTEFIKNGRIVLRLTDFMPASEYSTIYFPEIHRLIETPTQDIDIEIKFKPVFDFGRSQVNIIEKDNGYIFKNKNDVAGIVTDFKLEKQQSMVYGKISLEKNSSAWIVMVYGEKNLHRLKDYKSYDRLEETISYWKNWINQSNYSGLYRKFVFRSALVLKSLIFEPTGMIVAAPTSSLPESIGGERNWDYRFTWIRDSAYVIESLSLLGYKREAAKFLYDLMDRLRRENGIKTLYSINNLKNFNENVFYDFEGYLNSKPVRFGNGARNQLQLDIYGELLNAIYFFQKSGGLVNAYLWDFVINLLDDLSEKWMKRDSSIWEFRTRKKHYVYSKVMAWLAFKRAIDIGKELNYSGHYITWSNIADTIKKDVLLNGYNREIESFVQFYGGKNVDGALLRLPIVGFIPASDQRFKNTLKKIEKDLMYDKYFFKRYNIDDGIKGDDNLFLLLSFWYIDDLILLGDIEKAKDAFESVMEKSNHLYLFSEELDIKTYDLLGNFPQALTHLAVITTAYRLHEKLKNL